ncbi:MAG: glutamine synthetase family protein [Actinomycetota bacterium]|jgi:glutamine synthetase|nr:glutamine synthetase family protein [Actinomycetota bacterium]
MPDTVILAFPDTQGRPVGKRVTGTFFEAHAAEHGIDVCDYLLGVDVDMTPMPGYRSTGWDTGYGDLNARPDMSTFRLLPWLEGTALVLCDLYDAGGAPVEVSPRRILQRQVERAAERGLDVQAATELEFYLFWESFDEAAAQGWCDLHPHSTTIQDYQLLQTSRQEYVLRRIRNEMIAAGIPVESSKGEAGRGQHEVNVAYAGALETADRHLVFKNGVKEIAAQEGRAASFMAKWTTGEVGSSCHLHTSLWRAGEPLMAGADDVSHLSDMGRRFVAGQIHAARELAWCFAPTANSYRRYVAGSWAPTAAVWGEDNRTCGFRLVGHGPSRRVESRIPGADANPYIALAAAVAAGLYGIDHTLELGDPYRGNAYEATDVARIPTSLGEAADELERSPVAAEAFGPDVHHHMVNTARQEWEASVRAGVEGDQVSGWELARCFERF